MTAMTPSEIEQDVFDTLLYSNGKALYYEIKWLGDVLYARIKRVAMNDVKWDWVLVYVDGTKIHVYVEMY